MVDPAAGLSAPARPPDETRSPARPPREPAPGHEQEQEQDAERDDTADDTDDDDDDDDVAALPLRASARSPDAADAGSELRQRRANNSTLKTKASFTTPASPSPLSDAAPRRSSSFASQTSASSRPSFRSADSFFAPGAPASPAELHADHEPSAWQSAPLLLAVLPAILGVAFKKGSVLITDLALLCLAAVYLNWCLVTPWNWYREARGVIVAPEDEEAVADDLAEAAKDVADPDQPPDKPHQQPASQDAASANRELRLHELTALAACFLGPLVGAYLLHTIRTSLSSFGDELVSNMHLTLFVLGAELRPARHAVKLIHARTLHLQRIVRADAHAHPRSASGSLRDQLLDLQSRTAELETAVADAPPSSAASGPSTLRAAANPDEPPPATIETVKKAQHALQTQIDALNRAVRRYEKRATAQTLQTEATLGELAARLQDALSLAAAAARDSQKGGFLEALARALRRPFAALYRALLVPVEFLARALVRGLEGVGFVRRHERRRVVRRAPGAGRRDKAVLAAPAAAGAGAPVAVRAVR